MPSSTPLVRRGRRGRLLWTVNDDPEMDTAAIRVCNGLDVPVEVFGQLTECADCPLQSLSYGPIDPHNNSTILTLTSSYGFRLEVRDSTDNSQDHGDPKIKPKPEHSYAFAPCSLDYHFNEYGQYTWNVGRHPSCGSPALGIDGDYDSDYYSGLDTRPRAHALDGATMMESPRQMDCEFHALSDGYPSYLPILVYGVGVLLALPLLWLLLASLNRVLRLYAPRVYAFIWTLVPFLVDPNSARRTHAERERPSASAQTPPQSGRFTASTPATEAGEAAPRDASGKKAGLVKSRVVCVDVLRGIAIAVMIFGRALVIMA